MQAEVMRASEQGFRGLVSLFFCSFHLFPPPLSGPSVRGAVYSAHQVTPDVRVRIVRIVQGGSAGKAFFFLSSQSLVLWTFRQLMVRAGRPFVVVESGASRVCS